VSGGLCQLGPYLASALAVLLSLLNLYLQRRDRTPRLRVRVRYEYRAEGAAAPAIHDRTQEGLYMRLGEFLKEHGLSYPRAVSSGVPLVRLAVSNPGEKPVYLVAVRLELRARILGRTHVLDPKEGRLRPAELAGEAPGNLLSAPVKVPAGGGVGYRFELVRLSEILVSEGFAGEARLFLAASDRTGRTYRKPFAVNTDLWASQPPP
jgi:hypothetical protein